MVCLKIWVTLRVTIRIHDNGTDSIVRRIAASKNADYELCTALLTAILREDHFSNGSFERRQRAGQVDEILKRMVAELNK